MYDLIKALHVVSMVLWIGNMAGAAFTFHIQHDEAYVKRMRQLMGIGISLTWLTGLYLVFVSGYYVSHWFWVKFIVVFGLSGLHGAVIKQMRLRDVDAVSGGQSPSGTADGEPRAPQVPIVGFSIIAGALLVSYLVLSKPF